MKPKIFAAAILLLAEFSSQAQSAPKLRIVATVVELADITRRIGGEWVEVDGMARGPEDIHQVTMRPSLVTKLNRANAVVMLGLTVEHSFLPGLLEVARNPRIKPDPKGCAGPGCIDCSKGVRVLERPDDLSRSQGELHPQGNPHYNLDPENGVLIARNIAEGLSRIAPQHTREFQKNLKGYLSELDSKLAQWRQLVAPLKGTKAVSYHKDVAYLGRFTGIHFIDALETKPGIPPSPAHIDALVQEMKSQQVQLLVREQQFDAKLPAWVAQQTGAKIAVIGVMANALPGTETFIKMSEHNIRALVAAMGKEPS